MWACGPGADRGVIIAVELDDIHGIRKYTGIVPAITGCDGSSACRVTAGDGLPSMMREPTISGKRQVKSLPGRLWGGGVLA